VDRIVRLVQSLGSRLQPDVTISMIPAGQNPDDPLVSQAAQAGVDLNAVPGSQTEVVGVVAPSVGSALVSVGETAGGSPQAESSSAPPADIAAATPTAVAAAEPAEPAIATPVQQTPPAQQTATPAPPTATAEPTAEASATATATQEPTSTATGTAIATQALTQAATAGATFAATRTLARTTAAATTNTSTSTRTAAAGTATPTLTQTVSLLGLATSTPIPAQPAATPTSAATATPAPLAIYEVRRGDTLFEIASQYDVTVEDLLGANGLNEDDVYTIQPGDELKIPAPTPEGGTTESSTESNTEGGSATATPAPAAYTVRAGDTVLAIALRNGVSMEDMLAANGMTIDDARTLQPGDELVIPGAEGVSTPVATASGTATATATSATALSPTATPAPESAVRVDAPRLRAPENGTAVSCGGQGTLTWLQVPSVRPTDLYLVHLGYVNSIAGDGQEEVIWVINQQRPISATSWQLNNDLCGLAPNTAGKQWRWYVEVVEAAADGLRPVSPASPVWGFNWQ
jgi:LysM repeat protein